MLARACLGVPRVPLVASRSLLSYHRCIALKQSSVFARPGSSSLDWWSRPATSTQTSRRHSSFERDPFPKLQTDQHSRDEYDPELTFKRHVWKDIAFVLLFSGGVFGVMAWQEQERRKKGVTWQYMMNMYRREFNDWKYHSLATPQDLFERLKRMTGLDAPWSPGQATAATIIAFHAFITLSFSIAARRSRSISASGHSPLMVMESLWTHYPPQRRMSTYLSAMFSHRDVMHCAVNSYVLWSFAPYMINNLLGNEQFWAVYLAGGMFASLASTLNQTLTSKFHPSLGASGAIYTLVALLTMAAPHTKINLFFVLPLELWQGMSAMVLFDIIGLFFYKRFPLDHAAHLGGAAFGLWYALIGAKWWRERDSVRATLEAN